MTLNWWRRKGNQMKVKYWQDSNPRPLDYEKCAVPLVLQPGPNTVCNTCLITWYLLKISVIKTRCDTGIRTHDQFVLKKTHLPRVSFDQSCQCSITWKGKKLHLRSWKGFVASMLTKTFVFQRRSIISNSSFKIIGYLSVWFHSRLLWLGISIVRLSSFS